MTYIQPLITSAFATYPVNYGGRSVDAVKDSEAEPETFSMALANLNGTGSVAPIGDVEKSYETDSVRNGEKAIDRDAGKPKSASGDVLDLSQEAKDVWGSRSTDRAETNAEIDKKAADKAEVDAKVDTAGDRISLDSAANSTTATKNDESLETGASELTPEEQEQVKELKARDTEVRTHEQTHVSVGGAYVTGGPSYTYQTGPDGKKYAIGGSVSINTSPISGDPEATIQKMQTVARAALAPAEPSGQDQKVAASARQKEAEARAELNQQNAEKLSGDSTEDAESGAVNAEAATENEAVATGPNESSKSASTIGPKTDISASNLSKSTIGAYEARNAMTLSSVGSRFSAFA